MWTSINRFATTAFDGWLALLGGLPPGPKVCITALPLTLFALLVFRYASSQSGIRAAKDRIKAYLLELWLYKDDPAVLLRAQGQVILSSLEYLGYSLAPLAIMIVPVALLVVQVESHFAWRGPVPGESVIVSATLPAASAADVAGPALAGGPGLSVETPPLRLAAGRQVLWRVRAEAPGRHRLELQLGGTQVTRELAAGPGAGPLAPAVYRAGDWRLLGSPAEPPLDATAAVTSIDVDYPRARGAFLGLSSLSWLLFAASLVLGYALRGFFGVTF